MGSTADLTTAIPWETQHVQIRRDEVRDAGDELCAIERQRAKRRWQKLRQGCRLLPEADVPRCPTEVRSWVRSRRPADFGLCRTLTDTDIKLASLSGCTKVPLNPFRSIGPSRYHATYKALKNGLRN